MLSKQDFLSDKRCLCITNSVLYKHLKWELIKDLPYPEREGTGEVLSEYYKYLGETYQPQIVIKIQVNYLDFVVLSFGRYSFYSLKISRGNV